MRWLEIMFWRLAQRIIRKGYGADCKTRDMDDYPKNFHGPDLQARCPSCRAKEVIEWIDEHIELLKW